ncbi:ABC transporter ATP-binding protein [Myxococcus sp. CA051A]|uniref:ABC transporter ATP-binding protein n=1 Tax=unclassified Myxococcus TaxID=2648731 RepID=UPI00157B382B|nr:MULTISPECIES: ABC transporter ATP-binding protein [unclassified Myxococcus]NTX07387.1 ABC transporter ATP-binding protein [Myxococcus sp. CA040A]NTX37164.1 ABC transporter ATP-binding protein [Myxococcus sp. CA033]NTX52098.1 ABC transporter ATP-binding protein [Myxococcus sp. CA039A]NTX60222.1 ABC transporter ATP-binding protein [Myxococcus sp. CA051A]
MAAISLEGLFKSYGATPVVRGLSLEVREGELVSLLGPSGCGKTTTLRMLAGLEHPDTGVIRIGGEMVAGPGVRVPPERRGLGMVFQGYAVWPHRSVEENVAYPLTLRRMSKTEVAAKVREALRWVRLEALATRRPHELSGGQLQRVALARALVASPRVLLLDEPLSNLDAALREELRAELAALRARLGTTLVFVTHDQGEALALSDRIAVMNQGVLEQVDAPETLYREPATPFVAGFVGGANVLTGEVREGAFHTARSGTVFQLPADTSAPPGPATLVVRPEDLALGEQGTPLPLSARLFLGHAAEYRFPVDGTLLRVVAPPLEVRPGQTLKVQLRKARLFSVG